jgi:HAD superfamily hydrolase (TIGR01549 family)
MVNTCLWDMECTLYHSPPELDKEWDEAIYKAFCKAKHLKQGKHVKYMFDTDVYNLGSKTKVLAFHGVAAEVLEHASLTVDKEKYIKKDAKLKEVFYELKDYTHALLTNSTMENVYKVLGMLDIEPKTFKRIITAENSNLAKPDPYLFQAAMRDLGKRPEECVSIGDKDSTDIIPPKKLGMKTIMVWNNSKIADYSAPTVYDVPLYVRRLE